MAAVLFLTLGVGDLTRPRGPHGVGRALVGAAVGMLAASSMVWLAGIPWWWLAPLAAVSAIWSLGTGSTQSRFAIGALVVVIVAVCAALLAPGASGATGGVLVPWFEALPYEATRAVPTERALLLVSYSVFLVQSANLVVMAVLGRTDARLPAIGSRLKGGRIIGPLERLFILWLALAGQALAVTAIIAAKSILRYPEVSGKKSSALAEYVLIGSLVSWSLALIIVPVH
ncbi:hypothetical protein [Schumannella luteola]